MEVNIERLDNDNDNNVNEDSDKQIEDSDDCNEVNREVMIDGNKLELI